MFYTPPQEYVPHPYQRKASASLVARSAALLLIDPGMGKTSITLKALARLRKRGTARKVLIIAPLRVCQCVWPEEVLKWREFNEFKVEVLHGPKKDAALAREADLYLVNPEGLPWLLGATSATGFGAQHKTAQRTIDRKRWSELGFSGLVVDEISRFKHTGSLRFKLLKQVLSTFQFRWGLTGSPAANGLEGLFGQAYTVDMGATFGAYITRYRNEHFTPAGYNSFDLKLKDGAEERIYSALAPLALRMAAEDYLELPEQIAHTVAVELPPAARTIYNALQKDLLAQISEGTVTAATAGVALNKCRQVASGGVYFDSETLLSPQPAKGERDWGHIHDAKTDALEELLEELQGQQVLVTYDFQHDIERIRLRLGEHIPIIGGGTTEKKAKKFVEEWNAGNLPYLFGHPAAMGHGLNLQGSSCRHVCHYSPTWDYELYDQVNRRVLRQGNTAKRVFIHNIVARGTVDEVVMRSLETKGGRQRALFDALKQLGFQEGQ